MTAVETHALFDQVAALAHSPSHASALAWELRNLPLPSRFDSLVSVAAEIDAPEDELLRATWVCARRLHFLFAYGSMLEFTAAALLRFPNDEMLTVCNVAAEVMRSGEHSTWAYLRSCADLDLCDGIAVHALLTALVQHASPPPEILAHGLELIARLSPTSTVGLYRKAAILRRLGLFAAALAAVDDASENLARGFETPATTDHLVERLFAERQLILAAQCSAPL